MNATEAKAQAARVFEYNNLCDQRKACYATLEAMHKPTGHHKVSAFTGNWRESRNVTQLTIDLSKTKGGEGTEMVVLHVDLSAFEFGQWIEAKVREKIAKLDKAIADL